MTIRSEDKHVGQRIKARRTVLMLTQASLADEIGITFQQVQKYEAGTNRVSASRLVDIAAALQVEVPYFFKEMPGTTSGPLPAEIKTADEHRLLKLYRQSTAAAQAAILNIAQQTAQPRA